MKRDKGRFWKKIWEGSPQGGEVGNEAATMTGGPKGRQEEKRGGSITL